MLTVVLGLSGALIYGASDFFGGLASRRTTALRVTLVSFIAALAIVLLALPVSGSVWSLSAVVYGVVAGVAGAGAIFLLYACLAIGPMSILSPLTALVSAVVPIPVGLLSGETLSPLGYWAIGFALVAVVLVGFTPERDAVRPTTKGIVMAVGSGILIGAYLILLHRTPPESGLVPLVADLLSGTVVTAAVVLVVELRARARNRGSIAAPISWRIGLALAIWCGATQAVANTLIVVGLHIGDLTVMSVLTALYPAGTIILAALVLKERVTPVQIVGLVLAIAAAALLGIS